jgi:hypothetical protein
MMTDKIEIGDIVSTPYGDGRVIQINLDYGVNVRFLKSGQTHWFKFEYVSLR